MRYQTSSSRGLGVLLRVAALLIGTVSAAAPHDSGSGSGSGSGSTSPGAARQQRPRAQGSEPCVGASSPFPGVPAMPAGAWDSHLHVTDPERFPPRPGAQYTPGVNTVWDNAVFERGIGCERVVLVQPSIYGADNTLLIDSLKAYGPGRARAVVVLDAAAANNSALLREWHALGVRGARVNVRSDGVAEPAGRLEQRLRQHARAIKPLNWVLQLYTPMAAISSLADLLPELGVRVVFDHLGAPALPGGAADSPAGSLRDVAGFDALVRLLGGGDTWVKISAPYRVSREIRDPEFSHLDPMIQELFRVAPSKLVYGSDWPHTRFEGLDIGPWTRHLLNMTRDDDELRRRLFTDNARELWGV